MLVVLEGPDRVGKTTLARLIARRMRDLGRNSMVVHRGAPQPGDHPLRDYAIPIAVYTPTTSDDHETHSIVCDRLHYGDLTYGPVYRDEIRQTSAMVAFTDGLIAARGGVKVHVTADAALIEQRVRDEGEDESYLKVKDVLRIVKLYNAVCGHDWKRINTTSWGRAEVEAGEVASILTKQARELETKARSIEVAATEYVGPHRPRALLIVNDDATHRNDGIATMTPWEHSVAETFIQAMIDAGLSLSSDVGMVNTDPTQDLRALHSWLGRPAVIVFDDIARTRATYFNLPIARQIDHPVHLMRQGTDGYRTAWVRRLAEAVPPTSLISHL